MRHYWQTKQVRIDLLKIGVYTDKEWGINQLFVILDRSQYLKHLV